MLEGDVLYSMHEVPTVLVGTLIEAGAEASDAIYDPKVIDTSKLEKVKSDAANSMSSIFMEAYSKPRDVPPPEVAYNPNIAMACGHIAGFVQAALIFDKTLPAIENGECGKSPTEIYSAKVYTLKRIAEALISAQEGYEKFATENPKFANYFLSYATLLLSAAITTYKKNPFAAVGGLIIGSIIGEVVGEPIAEGIEYTIDKGTKKLLDAFPELEPNEAYTLVAFSVKITGETIDVGTALKDVFSLPKIEKSYLDSVDKVNSRFPINADYAGKVMKMEDLPASIKKDYPGIEKLYPHGVEFNEKGFPKFEPYAIKKVALEKFGGNNKKDFDDANFLAGLKETTDNYTWHHHEDGKTMLLVPTDLHKVVRHTGGMAVYRANQKKTG